MNKPAVVFLGFVVAVGAVSAGGAWYTGKQLEPVLQTAIQSANKELQTSMAGVDGSVALATLGAGGAIDTETAKQPIIGFIFSNKGLMYNLTLEGTRITRIAR